MKGIRVTLRRKILLAVCLTFVLAGASLFAGSSLILLRGFTTLENDTVLTDIQRVENAIGDSLLSLKTFAGDWAGWSDTRDFILGQRPAYIEENLMDTAFVNARASFMAFLDNSGHVIHMKSVDLKEKAEVPNPESLAQVISQPAFTTHSGPRDLKDGIVMLPEGPMLVASGPITNNEFALPISGTFLVGRYLDDAETESLSDRTQLNLSFTRLDQGDLPPDIAAAKHALSPGAPRLCVPQNSSTVMGYTIINNAVGKPALMLRIEEPRSIYKQGTRTIQSFTGVIALAGVITFLILVVVLDRSVLRPVAKLHSHIERIRDSKDLSARVDIRSHDELGVLAHAFNEAFESLQSAQKEVDALHKKLIETARQAGMSEVASGVLHNVGNVLNSVNVATSTLKKQVREMRLDNLVKATDMMREHENDLGHFLTQDDRGSKLPLYIIRLSQQLKDERETLDNRLTELDTHVQHIAEIISLQQSLAKKIGVIEPLNLEEIMENAVKINDASLHRHGVTVDRHYETLPQVMVDRHQILQILVNLISNAKYAVDGNAPNEKSIVLRIEKTGEGRVRMSVTDNGMGIAPENLDRIFAHGFTTRAEGHGFGLHAAANAATQLDGKLSATSEGPGKGATFTLEIPFREAVG